MTSSASRWTTTRLTYLLLAFGGSACGDEEPLSVSINTSLIGTWSMVGFEDDGTTFAPSGTWVFFDDGTTALDLQFHFSGGRISTFAGTGYFTQTGDKLTLDIRTGRTMWDLDFTEEGVTLHQTAPPPADATIRLNRL